MTFWSASSNELARKYGVVGLPTIIFITSSGEEARHLRVEGFVDKEELLKRLRQLR
jgi:thiol:disulfide interchange protein